MNPEAHISGETLTVLWRAQQNSGATKYLVGVERCGSAEGKVISQAEEDACMEVLSTEVEQDSRTVMTLEETSPELAPCVDYHVILRAMAPTGMVSKETALVRKPESNCDAKTLQNGLVITICVLGILVLLCIIVLIYYLKRRPMGRLQRVRSKVYSRLYSRDRYERPIPKAEFIRRVGDLLRRHEEVEDEEEGDKRGSKDGLNWDRRRPRSLSSTSANTPMSPLRAEFDELDRLSSATIRRRSEAAALAVNRMRNRYHDIVPYDANRVRLQRPLALEEGAKGVRGEVSDYVNASAIGPELDTSAAASVTLPERANVAVFRRSSASAQDASYNTRYIAAQGPSDETAPLFWEMLWQQDVRVIVMLTNLVEGFGFGAIKCCQYWPEQIGNVSRYRDIEVQLYDVQEAPDYTVRKFDVRRKSATSGRRNGSGGSGSGGACVSIGVGGVDCSGGREMVQVQYKAWRDRSAPTDPAALLQLVQVVRSLANRYNSGANAPWLVHCSAGVGRTGTFMAVEQLLRACESRVCEDLDVFKHVYELRRQRRHMVQSSQQYVYIYKCLHQHMRNFKGGVGENKDKNKA